MDINVTEVLRKHKKWLDGDSEGERADLTGADLTGANLTGADLCGVNLTEVNLTLADLTEADLTRANLTRANLTRANLIGANLIGANLTEANLYGVNLYRANLTEANLTGVIFDFATWPLWCGSFGAKVDARLVWQLVAHLARVVPPDGDADVAALMAAIKPWANKFCEYRGDVKAV